MSGTQNFATLAIHAGQDPEKWTHGAVIPPVVLATTYFQSSPANPIGGYEYSRSGNPTRECLETALAAVEGAAYGLTFCSGLATTQSILQSFVKSGKPIMSSLVNVLHQFHLNQVIMLFPVKIVMAEQVYYFDLVLPDLELMSPLWMERVLKHLSMLLKVILVNVMFDCYCY